MSYNETKALKEAFPYSLPIMATYLLMGGVFGIMMANAGYSPWISLFISIIIYAGALQYLAVAWLAGGVGFVSIALITLSVNARQFFYAIACLRRYSLGGWRKWYLIFSVTDETFAILNLREQKSMQGKVALDSMQQIYNQKVMFYISLLNHCYWIIGCVCGTILGNKIGLIRDIQGLDFIVVATFCVLLYENMRVKDNRIPIAVGIFSTLFCFMLDKEHFLSYALVMIVCVLLAIRHYIQKRCI
ncbi:AzlC family ABC transporter permease [Helicobacter trogontum]|uniref:Branched-chain amino acid ABC transporter permease n=1 Tax=Helicobacter trogontum TaxID=50960 RepID=A0A4U8T9Z7_9HELI|nr:AzlC family ABC transporter permease [Helicobacter trogontum]TLD96680.1 branched-chain amino acid ABC transporter permease [Helicobacter trogontum]